MKKYIRRIILKFIMFVYHIMYQYEINPGNVLDGFCVTVYQQHQKIRTLRFKSAVFDDESIIENRINVLHDIIFNRYDLNSAFLKINHMGDHVTFEIVDYHFHLYPFKRKKYTKELICVYIPIKRYKQEIIQLFKRLNKSHVKLQDNILSDVAINTQVNGLLLSNKMIDRKVSFDDLLKGLPYDGELNSVYYAMDRNKNTDKIEITPVKRLIDLTYLPKRTILLTNQQLICNIMTPIAWFNVSEPCLY